MQQTLVFEPGEVNIPQCINISITIEDILEFDEIFDVQLNTDEPGIVLLNPKSSNVIILNDDSKIIIVY